MTQPFLYRLAVLLLLLVIFVVPVSAHPSPIGTHPAVAPPNAPLTQGAGCATTLFLPLVMGTGGNVPAPLGDEPPEDDDEPTSPVEVTLEGVSLTAFNPLTATLALHSNCGTFGTDPATVTVLLNAQLVPSDTLTVSTDTLSIVANWVEGRNHVQVVAQDSDGQSLTTDLTFWAGGNQLDVLVDGANDESAPNVPVTALLGDDQSVQVSGTTDENGVVTFFNLPDRTILLEALTAENHYASAAVRGGQASVAMQLLGFNPPSPIDNNDFSLGTQGWEIGDAPVEIIPHIENANGRTVVQAGDMDLELGTSGEGEQSISRTFDTTPGTKNVVVRYRFITQEIPGGYYGTEFNDYFNVSIRSLIGAGVAGEGNSMNGLGDGAFDANGATDWREERLQVDEAGDTIQVDIAVANVSDGQLDSQVVVDIIEEKPLAITALQLNDIDNVALAYLSADDHTYFSSNTRVHGTITIEGSSEATLEALTLEVVQGGAVVATGNLPTALQGTVLVPFGTDEKITVSTSQLLFELPSDEADNVDGTTDGTLTLRVKARTDDGEEATKEFGAVEILVRYDGTNRYGGRDTNRGGDDWVKPGVRTIIQHFTDITVGDMSNMNAGSFSPDHATHRTGNDMDGWFPGFNDINAATAATIIGHLNDDTYGSNITTVYVTFARVNGNLFWDAIKNVTLDDGRRAQDVIRVEAGHDTHFHWIMTPAAATNFERVAVPGR